MIDLSKVLQNAHPLLRCQAQVVVSIRIVGFFETPDNLETNFLKLELFHRSILPR
jgi:hypothetical protein